jgi:branched-chain amino acid transport system substrate-binding protein
LLCPTQWLTNLPNSEPLFGDAQKYDRNSKSLILSTTLAFHTRQHRLLPPSWYSRMLLSVPIVLTSDKVRDALSATDMDTFYGPVKFSEAGNNIAKPMFYRQIQADGSYKNIVS